MKKRKWAKLLVFLLAISMIFMDQSMISLAEAVTEQTQEASEESSIPAESTVAAAEAPAPTAEEPAPAAPEAISEIVTSVEEGTVPTASAEVDAPETMETSAVVETPSGTETPAVTETPAETETPVAEGTEASEVIESGAESESVVETESVTEEMENDVVEAETETETEIETESETKTETEIETESETEMETEIETESETETETEIETEEETVTESVKTEFSYQDSRVIIMAVAQKEANLPENAVLKADYIAPGSAAYEEAIAQIEAEYGSDNPAIQMTHVLYDVYFEADGEEIEPEAGTVSVTMTFKRSILSDVEGDVISRDVIHIKDNGETEKVTDYINTDSDGGVSAVGFTTDSFSLIAVTTTADTTEAVTTLELAPYITGADVEVKVGDEWIRVDNLDSVAQDAGARVRISYYPEGVKFDVNGATLTYTVPSLLVVKEAMEFDVKDGTEVAGRLYLDTDGKVRIVLDTDYLTKYNGYLKNGSFLVEGSFDAGKISGETDVVFGSNVTVKIPFEPDVVVEKKSISVKKTKVDTTNPIKKYEKGYNIEYKVKVTTPSDNTQTVTGVTVADVFTEGAQYVGSLDDVTVDAGAFDPSKKVWTIGEMEKGKTYTMTYKARVQDSFFNNGIDTNRKITNKATVSADELKDQSSTDTTVASATLGIDKNIDSVYDPETKTVSYKVEVTAPKDNDWTVTDVTVDDVFGTGKEYVQDYQAITVTKGSYTLDETSKKLSWTIGNMDPGEKVTLTYTIKVDDEIFLKQGSSGAIDRDLVNTANVKVNGTKVAKDSSTADFKKTWIKKSGTLDSSTGKVNYTVTANETPNLNIDGTFTFTDKLTGKDWMYDGDLTVKWYDVDGNYIGSASMKIDGKTTWTWSSSGTANSHYKYVFTYAAKLDPNKVVIGSPAAVGNTAGIGIGVGRSNYKHEASTSTNGKRNTVLTKSKVSVNENIASWKSVISCDVPAGATYTDYRDTSKKGFTFTDAQIKSVTLNKGIKGTDYVVERVNDSTFKITFLQAMTGPIEVTYACTLDTSSLKEGETGTYRNKGVLDFGDYDTTAQADCTYTKERRIDKDASTYVPETGILQWVIKINVTGNMSGDATVVEELPEGLVFDSVKRSDSTSGTAAKASTTMDEPVVSADGRTVTIQVHNLIAGQGSAGQYGIRIYTKIVDKEFRTGNTSKTFTNTAKVIYNGETTPDTASTTISNTALTKSGTYDETTAPYINYQIVVNPNGYDMLPNATEVEVTDTMAAGMELLKETFKVVGATSGDVTAQIKNTLNSEGNKFTFVVPDNEKFTVSYSAYFEGNLGESVDLINTVNYSLNTSEKGQTSTEHKIIVV
ncbi:MAG: hypothetical protein J6E42_06715, partial [Firmicutes bacterium]|nr:hypothetical protein [Bacillota bacterium]